MECAASTKTSILDRALDLDPQVSVRPEPFGALLYHFGTRRLSFLKDRRLLGIVLELSRSPSARAACDAVGIEDADRAKYERALSTLLERDMLSERVE